MKPKFSHSISLHFIVLALSVSMIFTFPLKSYSQNIYDTEHSAKYAEFLFNSKQYYLAAEEFERILFVAGPSDSIRTKLIQSYLRNQQFARACNQMTGFFPETEHMPRAYALNYSRALLSQNKYTESAVFTTANKNLSETDKFMLNFDAQLLNFQWKQAQDTYSQLGSMSSPPDRNYASVMKNIQTARYKSPALALGLSALVPGLGKVYTHNWKDGLIALVFVGGSAFQAWRGYEKRGPGSGYFITYACISSAFYIGNLYGSYKSAKKYNEKVKKRIHDKILSDFNAGY